MARETINGLSVPIPDTGEPPDFVGDLRRIASDLPASLGLQDPVSRAVMIGSSIEQQAAQGADYATDPNGGDALRARGWFHWANAALAAQGKGLDLVYNAGVGGNRWDQMLARFDTDVIAHNPSIVFLGSPTNDIGAGRTVAQITADGENMIEKCRAIGARLVILQIEPRSSFTTLAKRAVAHEVNRWIANAPAIYRLVTAVDAWSPLCDPATGDPKYGVTLDGTHPSIAGAAILGLAVAAAVAPFIPVSRPPLRSFALDTRRFLDNPTFNDDGSGWASNDATADVTFEPADDGYGNKAVIAISGNSHLTNIIGMTRTQYTSDFLEPGDLIQTSCRIKWANLVALGGNTPCQPSVRVDQIGTDGTVLRQSYALYSATSEWNLTWPSTDNSDPWPTPTTGELVLTTYRNSIHPDCDRLVINIGWRGAASVDIEVSDLAPLKGEAATADHPSDLPYERASRGSNTYMARFVAGEIGSPDGTKVASWSDIESGKNMYHPTPDNQPTIETDGDGVRTVRADGVNDYLYQTALGEYGGRVTVARVMSDAPATDQGIVSSGSTGNPAGATNVGIIRRVASGLAGTYWAGSRTTTADTAGAWPPGQWVVLAQRHDDGDARAERNGVVIATSSAASGGVLPVGAEMFRRTTAYGRVEIAEDIFYPPGALTDAEMAAVLADIEASYPTLLSA